jgi:hypothetical protein
MATLTTFPGGWRPRPKKEPNTPARVGKVQEFARRVYQETNGATPELRRVYGVFLSVKKSKPTSE